MITPDDLQHAARHSRAALTPLQDSQRWAANPADMEWTCRSTLDHVVNALLYYSSQLARPSPERHVPPRDGAPNFSVPQLLDTLESGAAILAAVARAAPPGARSYHRAGMADAEGFLAMGCAEILVHTEDIAAAIGDGYRGPDDLTARVVARLFPWAPEHDDTWALFRWCAGRAALPAHERQGPEWWWWCAPLDEWTGGAAPRLMPT